MSELPIEASRVRSLLQLANRLHDAPPDPLLRKRATIEGLVAMMAAEFGACAVLHDEGGSAPVILSSAIAGRGRPHSTRSGTTRQFDDAGDKLLNALIEATRNGLAREQNGSTSSPLLSIVPLDHKGNFGALAFVQKRGVGFSLDDQALVKLFHQEMRWIYDLDLPLASPDVVALPVRARETLQCLLAGLSEKQIASQLALKQNTIHHYVKVLYRHFLVSSRSELLARWFHEKRQSSD